MEKDTVNITWKRKPVKTPTVLQMEMTECGAASLAIVMAYYHLYVPLEKLRIDCGVSRDGSNATNIIKAANAYGFDADCYREEPEGLDNFVFPAILHWGLNHFVVLEGRKGNMFYINDPASGRRKVSDEEFDNMFTGILLELTPNEKFKQSKAPESLLLAFLSRLKNFKVAILYIFICSLLLAVPGIIIPTASRIFVDDVLGQNPNWLLSLIVALIATALVNMCLAGLRQSAMIKLSIKFAVSTSSFLFYHMLRMPAEFYFQRSPGELQYRMSLNSSLSALISGQAGQVFSGMFMVVFYLILMFQYDVVLASAGIVIAILNILVLRFINSWRQTTSQTLIQEKCKLMGVTANGIQIIETIKSGATDFDYFAKWAGHQANTINAEQTMGTSNIYASALPALLSGINNTGILILGAWRVINGDMSMGMLVAFQALMAGFLAPVSMLSGVGVQLQEAKGSVDKVNDLLKYPRDAAFDEASKSEAKPLSDKAVLEGELEMKDITFGYAPLGDPLVRNFSLHLKPGRRIAIIGRSGSGKSTIGKLAAGLYKPWSGSVLFDGRPSSEYSRDCIENSLAVVDQDIAMFSGTIRENLTMWNGLINDKDIINASKDARIHSDIVFRSGGYGAELTEDGRNFSGGQRQRLEIARALMNDPSILILDEATSALDPETEKEINDKLKKRGCSCLIIAHRLSTIRDCDEIIVMDKGMVVQRGSHKQLIMDSDGPYVKLIKSE